MKRWMMNEKMNEKMDDEWEMNEKWLMNLSGLLCDVAK